MRKTAYFIISMVLLCPGFTFASGGNLPGSGTDIDPYLIEDRADFDAFADPCNASTYWSGGVHTKLTCDLDLSGNVFETAVIAPDTSSNDGFQGTSSTGEFDGNGHIISNLTIDDGGAGNCFLGLFGKICPGSQVINLGLEDSAVTSGDDSYCLGSLAGESRGIIIDCYAIGTLTGGNGSGVLGCLVGWNEEGSVTNCYATGAVTGGSESYYLGGLLGLNIGGNIINCYATGTVTSTNGNYGHCLGGLMGSNMYATITNCYATGAVTGGDYSNYLGGLMGVNHVGSITNCYATGTIAGGDNSDSLGGLAGWNCGSITNCYATGVVTGDGWLGGLVGCDCGDVTDCYFLNNTAGPNNGIGEPLTSEEICQQNSFVGWDFSEEDGDPADWKMPLTDGYPQLAWELDLSVDIVPDGIVNLVDFSKMAEFWLDYA